MSNSQLLHQLQTFIHEAMPSRYTLYFYDFLNWDCYICITFILTQITSNSFRVTWVFYYWEFMTCELWIEAFSCCYGLCNDWSLENTTFITITLESLILISLDNFVDCMSWLSWFKMLALYCVEKLLFNYFWYIAWYDVCGYHYWKPSRDTTRPLGVT